jgi:hypothetical protein
MLTLTVAIPTVNAQEISMDEKAVQIVIKSPEEIHVKHVVSLLNSPKQLGLINGTVTNLMVLNEEGKEKQFGVIGKNDSVVVFTSQENTIIEYDLKDVLVLKDNVWTWNFRYLETTSFWIPQEADVIFVNDRPVQLDGKKGIVCHGCQMVLEYSLNEPKILKNIKLENKEFLVEIKTFAEINQFNFEHPTKTINFKINGEHRFITAIIPIELLSGPYTVFSGNEKINSYEYINNGTHVWLNMRPDHSGNLSIVGTTVMQITNENQDYVYVLFVIIVSAGLTVTVIILRKKKL